MTNTKKEHELSTVDASEAKIAPASPQKPVENAGASSLPAPKAVTKNALTHGVYATDFVLPIESQDDFEALLASFKAEWSPQGASEEQAVIELAHTTWIGWRAARMAQLQFHRAPFGMEVAGKTSWPDILHHETVELPEHLKSAASNIDYLLKNFNALLEVARNRPYSTDTANGKDAQMRNLQLAKEVSDTIERFKEMVHTIDKFVNIATSHWSRYDKAYDPEFIEQQLRVMAAVGARTDKILRRLTSLKEYKRVASEYSPKELNTKHQIAPTPESLAGDPSEPNKTMPGDGADHGESPNSKKVGA
jgi:hypothetical protein